MKIGEKAFVNIHYTLTINSGEVVDKSDPERPLGFVFGKGIMIPGLEKQIEGLEEGAKKKIVIPPEEGYGEPRAELINEIPRKNFPEEMDISVGMTFQASGPHGPINLMVKEIKDDAIIADFNHPLAGQTLNFDVEIVGVRESTQEEIDAVAAGSACGGCACDSTECGVPGGGDDGGCGPGSCG
ncbi:MAG: peptidylprolyl isomerase [Proteobacteria bacterium]|nr:peptidylprolyl isomerase [Pseudomonadota bacterium]